MKDTRLERLVVGARNDDAPSKRQFISQTMQRVRLQQTGSRKPKHSLGLLARVQRLHGVALILFIVLAASALGGSAYAVIWSIPHIFHVDSVHINSRGQTQYTVSSFPKCTANSVTDDSNEQQFALKKSAPVLSNEEVSKILQAKCELLNIDDLIRTTWPTHGSHTTWQKGDGIFYARADLLGNVSKVTKGELVLSQPSGTMLQSKTYSAQADKQLKAISMSSGQSISVSSVRSGDVVMSVVEAEETYNGDRNPSTNPRVLGAIGLVKLDLPIAYYTAYQGYLTDIDNCFGNSGELCPNTSSLDIYPRVGGEGARNPYATPQGGDSQARQIDGTVTELSARSLRLKSIRGNTYTVTLGEDGFSVYNTTYAPTYIAEGSDATLRIGSFIGVMYTQAKSADPRVITPQQLQTVSLLLDDSGNLKVSGAGQY